MKISQAVIPAAGLGTRFLPATKSIPKELIPLVDKPCLHHVVDELVAAGIEEIIFIVSTEKEGIENYFRPNESLYHWLEQRGQKALMEDMRRLDTQVKYHFVVQREPLGLGHAVSCAREIIKDDYFFVVLPDDIIAAEMPVCRQMTGIFTKYGKPMVSVMQVEWQDVDRYGIVQASALTDHVGDVLDIIEKPKRDQAPSNLAVIGRYILPKNIFKILEQVTPGAGGEIQLTDALRQLISGGGLHSYSFTGERFDTGTPLGLLQANLAFALQRPEMKDILIKTVKSLAALYL